LHDDWVVETLHDALEDVVKERKALRSLVTQDLGRAHLRELAEERLGRLDSGGVVKRQYTKDISSLKGGSGLLDEVDNTILLGNKRHVHLHNFDFSESLTLLDVLAVLDGELDKLTGGRSSELSGVVLLLEQAGLAVDTETSGTNLLLPVGVVTAAVEQDEQTTVGKRSHTNGTSRAVDVECVAVESGAGDSELVTRSIVDEVDREDSLENVLGGDLTLLQADTVLGVADVTGDVSLGDGTRDDGEDGIGTLGGELLGDQLVEPSSSNGVVLEGRGLEQLDEVLDSGSEITTNAQFLESDNHLLTRSLSVLTVGENVTELRIGETVNGWSGTDWEVTPDVCARSEVQLVHGTAGRLEALTRVLGGDTTGSGMALGLRSALVLSAALLGEVEIDLGGGVGVNTVEETNVANAVERQTHSNLQLGGGKVDTRDHLGGRMFDLKTRVQLEEVELVVVVRVQVLDGTCRHVTDQATQRHSSLLHLLESLCAGNGDGSLLDNLLMSTLDRTVTTEQRDVVAVLISEQLDFQMSGVAGKLHDEDGRTRDFAGSSLVHGSELFLVVDLADTLTTTTLGGLDHDGETNLLGCDETLLPVVHATFGVDIIVDGNDVVLIDLDFVDTLSWPRDTGYAGVLCDDGRRNLVTERSHGRARRTDEDDLVWWCGEGLGQLGVFWGVTPGRVSALARGGENCYRETHHPAQTAWTPIRSATSTMSSTLA
jgi:hypothetical protein